MTDRDALRERVARAMYGRWRTTRPNAPIFDNLFQEARESELLDASVAIAICFEEAAQMTRPPAHMLGSTDSYANGYRAACDEIAAALWAYVSKHIILPLPQENINAES